MAKKWWGFALVFCLIGMTIPPAAQASAAGALVTVTVSAPEGVPATAVLRGVEDAYVTKAPAGISRTTTVEIPTGTYKVSAPAVVHAGQRYVLSEEENEHFQVGASGAEIRLSWVQDETFRNFHVSKVNETEVDVSWESTEPIDLMRIEGAVQHLSTVEVGEHLGRSVTGLADVGVKAGQLYTYVAARNGAVLASLVVGVPDTRKENYEAVVRDYGAVFFESDPGASISSGQVVLPWSEELGGVPLIGNVVVLPASDALSGGFLGKIASVSSDGKQVTLEAAAFGEAFASAEVRTPDLSSEYFPGEDPETPGSLDVPSTNAVAATEEPVVKREIPVTGKPTGLPRTGSSYLAFNAGWLSSRAQIGKGLPLSLQPTAVSNIFAKTMRSPVLESSADVLKCDSSVEGALKINLPKFDFAQHFKFNGNKYAFGVPVAYDLDVLLAVQTKLSAEIAAKASGACSVPFDGFPPPRTFVIAGVPMTLKFEPEISASFSAESAVKDIGVVLTNGFQVKAHAGLASGLGVDDFRLINKSEPLPSKAEAKFEFEGKLGGGVDFGPGIGTSDAGALAGLYGDLTLVNLNAGATFGTAGLCLEMGAKSELSLGLRAKAWFGPAKLAAELELFNGSFDLFGPLTYPKDCNKADQIKNDVIGDGLSVVSDQVTGSNDQIGHLEGFAPGHKAWVLSTGKISDAVGEPSDFASTALDRPGDEELTHRSGFPTWDAVRYVVDLVPAGSRVNVKYIFASEEYPEYVGSSYNDVMSVKVDGKECSFVPSTEEPVSVNTVNELTNSEYFVDNSNGANGYETSYDGLTVPMLCSVPVTPGKRTRVEIAVADSSDSVYDSAVALLDRGIWSD